MICTNCGNDDACEGYRTCTDCLEEGVFDPGDPELDGLTVTLAGLDSLIDALARDLLQMHHETGIDLGVWPNARELVTVAGYEPPPRLPPA